MKRIACESCGAPMVKSPGKNYLYCEYCQTFHFPENNNKDKVEIIGDEKLMKCPICRKNLVEANIEGEEVAFCNNCQGMLLPRKSFIIVIDKRRAQYSGKPMEHLQKIDQKDLKRTTHCPKCKQKMETHPYYGPGRVVIDSCAHCSLIWLDQGEMTKIEKA
ncbi:MAG: zf-TFIIB domain-containing protein [Myxococcota bacterium]